MTLIKMTRYYDLLAVEVCCVTAYVVDIFVFSRREFRLLYHLAYRVQVLRYRFECGSAVVH